METIVSELNSVLRKLEAATAAGDAEELLRQLYDDDIVVVGEGQSEALKGVAAFGAVLTGFMAEWGTGTRIAFKLAEPVVASATVAAAFVDATCQPGRPGADAEHYRVGMVWKRGANGWRIALEMFGSGSL